MTKFRIMAFFIGAFPNLALVYPVPNSDKATMTTVVGIL